MVPQPPLGTELSTGTPRGSDSKRDETLLGVAVPGVDGGVNAGETSDGGGGCVSGVDGCRDGAEEAVEATSSFSTVMEAGSRVEREKFAGSRSPSFSAAEVRGE